MFKLAQTNKKKVSGGVTKSRKSDEEKMYFYWKQTDNFRVLSELYLILVDERMQGKRLQHKHTQYTY